MVNKLRIILICLLVCGLWASSALALTVQAVTGQDQVVAGESLQLQLRLDGSPDAEPDFTPLQENWEILSSSQSSQMQIVNGSFKRSAVYSLILMPRTEGSLLIPAICFDKDCSLPLPIEVLPRLSQGGAKEEQILLTATISTNRIVTQGQLLLKVRLLLKAGLSEGQLSEPQPTGVEVLIKKLNTDVRKYEKQADGRVYQVIERDYAIFPQGSGQMQIPALQFDGVIAGARTRLDPFARQGKRVRRTSQPLQVEVTPLPKDLGRRPWIPATSVVFQDDWQQQRPNLVVGEPATRTLRLSADGVLAAQLPELKPAVPDDFKTYPDQPNREDQRGSSNSGIRGVLEQKIALVPTRVGRYQLPAYDLDWWDVTTGQWRQVQIAALEIDVAPATEPVTQNPPSMPATPTGQERTDVVAVAPQTAASATSVIPAIDREPSKPEVWFRVSLGLAFGWLLTLIFLFFWRRRSVSVVQEMPVIDPQHNQKEARRAAVQAARNNDPQATRKALRIWSRTLWPSDQNDAYEQLCIAVDPMMRKELENLDRCLYGRSGVVWSGQEMAACLEVWRPVSSEKVRRGLPALYPEKGEKESE